ncbi:MAG: lipoprotein, partial [Oscillospiraceae bacterium]|nr:lipoprotein [Oscillospiraceae bacterium]
MKKLLPALLAVLLLSACTPSLAETTPTPGPTPTVEVTPAPEETATALPWSSSWSDLRWLVTQDGMLFYPFV